MRSKILTATTLAFGLLAAACAAGPASGSGATIVEDDTPDVEAASPSDDRAEQVVEDPGEDPGAGLESDAGDDGAAPDGSADDAGEDAADLAPGTRDNPLPVGTRIAMGDWTLAVTGVTLDAAEQVAAENQFNDPPADGRQFVMFSVEATYEGQDSGTAWLDFSWAVVGAGGNTFGTSMDDYCGVIPDSLDDTSETFPGGSVSGNVCVSVEAAQVDGATIRLEEAFSLNDTRVFYALD